MKLRPDQEAVWDGVRAEWSVGHRNVLAVAPCGWGKTVLFGHALSQEQGATVAIAHRAELVSQMSLALARYGVRHRVIGTPAVARNCATIHMAELGRHYVDAGARCAVASVQTLVRRDPGSDPWFKQVSLVVNDEAHHVIRGNSWGNAIEMFPNARVLGVTATPERSDGKGLGRQANGIFDAMVLGPTMRESIKAGNLTEYRIFAPKTTDLDLSAVPTSASGDFSPAPLRKAVHKSHIVGDVVASYLRIAPGMLGLTFAVDVAAATELAAAYRASGVTAEVVTGETPDLLRMAIMRKFVRREVLQICSVDIFGEGTDIPGLEVISFARPTQSYPLYEQMFCRTLRRKEGKTYGIVIDHVGNVQRHGLPDAPRKRSLAGRDKRSGSGPSDTIPLSICLECTSAYEAFHKACPYCGAVRVPAGRSAPEQVDGVLEELDPAVLARLRGEVATADAATPAFHPDARINGANHRRTGERRESQAALRRAMTVWGGWQTHQGRSNDEAQRRFFFRYGTDTLSAWLLDRAEADKLREWIEADLQGANVVALVDAP